MTPAAFFAHLHARPANAPALVAAQGVLDTGALLAAVEGAAQTLRARRVRVLATALDNGPAWAIADLAALRAGIVHVPLPGFFTEAQRAHVLQAAGVDAVLAPQALAGFAPQELALGADALVLNQRHVEPVSMPPRTAKITFTSGTTGAPKGVCLAAGALLDVAQGVAGALERIGIGRHLCSLPLPLLLENVAGLYAPLLEGAASVLLPSREVGLSGSSSFDPARLEAAVERFHADSVITLPQMLRSWAGWRLATGARSSRVKFVAVGGATVGATLIDGARNAGLPAYEGYGLSECGSVQTLNVPRADVPGSVGRPLAHAQLRIAADGEIEVAGTPMLGYLGGPAQEGKWWATGDLGAIDTNGFVHVRGRKKNVLITAFGRNVSPEWVEAQLQAQPAIAHAVVFGEGAPALCAVLWPVHPATGAAALAEAVAAANTTLPDYARVLHWTRALQPFSVQSGMATANGRPQRAAIESCHDAALARGFNRTPMPFFDRLVAATAADRARLVSAPIIQGTLRGEVSVPSYIAFLREAYHHVRHTVPLLQACHARLPDRLAWMRPALDEYVREEAGHDAWILDDIAACGGDVAAVRDGRPDPATEVMVAYAYDTIARGNPAGFLGMVHVLEGTSVALALTAADSVQGRLQLPDSAFSYLRSHGTLDREHTKHFAELVNALTDAGDQEAVIHGARMFYRLYGDVFRGLPLPQAATNDERAGAVAA